MVTAYKRSIEKAAGDFLLLDLFFKVGHPIDGVYDKAYWPPLRILTWVAGFKIISGDHYTTTVLFTDIRTDDSTLSLLYSA